MDALRDLLLNNKIPLYYFDAGPFEMLGMQEWVANLYFIHPASNFKALHQNIFAPEQGCFAPNLDEESINNALLNHREVQDFIKARQKNGLAGKALFTFFNKKTEQLAAKLGLNMGFPNVSLRQQFDDKIRATRLAQKSGIPCVPNVICKIDHYEQLRRLTAHLGENLVIQLPFGNSGATTYFINDEADFNLHKKEISGQKLVKVVKNIRCRSLALDACVTSQGVISAPLMTDLVGFQELTPFKGGWCGNEFSPSTFSDTVRQKAQNHTLHLGEQMKRKGYRGCFGLDFLLEEDSDELYFCEINPRLTGLAPITNNARFAQKTLPLFLFHLLEWLDIPFRLNASEINQRWAEPDDNDNWSSLILKHSGAESILLNEPPVSGIWQMNADRTLTFARPAAGFLSIQADHECFFLSEKQRGASVCTGDCLGSVFLPKQVLQPTRALTPEARQWIESFRAMYHLQEIHISHQ